MKKITVLGVTGSIGTQTIDVVTGPVSYTHLTLPTT